MTAKKNRTYLPYTQLALKLLAGLIREERLMQKVSMEALSERACISRGLLQRIEKGDPGCSIGAYFEVAALLNIPLFEEEQKDVRHRLLITEEKLALLPKSVRKSQEGFDDDF